MSKSSKSVFIKKSPPHALITFLLVGLIVLTITAVNILKNTADSFKTRNVLGDKSVLTPCSSGNLKTSTNKIYQMTYPNETFLQLTNTDLLKDVSQLKDLTCLQYLDATDRLVKGDISNLKNLTNLEVFTLFSNPDVYGDICSLSGATKLRVLKFAFDPKITGDVSCLKNLTKLEVFAMTHTQISGDLSVFANMPNLKSLYINGTKIKGDICSLSKLTNLEELGVADEVGNPDITGNLACLDNLQKLKRVSLYNTGTTNCEQFTKSHSNIAQMGKTESGRPAGGGCSKESRETLVNVAQKYEKKIGKDVYQESGNQERSPEFNNQETNNVKSEKQSDSREGNFFTKFVDAVRNLLSRVPILGDIVGTKGGGQNGLVPGGVGPGGCKSQSECEAFCSKPENNEICSKFTPPGSEKDKEGESNARPNLEQGGPGGCKSQKECQDFCSKSENSEECSKFSPPGEKK